MKPTLIAPVETPYLVPFDGSFRVKGAPTAPPGKGAKPKDKAEKKARKKAAKKELAKVVEALREKQRMLYAQDRYSLLLVFQAMDAAGKDGTIRAVTSGINPAGCQVYSFKSPSAEELDHDFLWRINRSLPERGRIGIFNRSHYEEVLVVRVHPEYLGGQRIPRDVPLDALWEERYESIGDMERHLARNGTVIVKFWLNVSRDEQRDRFLARIDEPEANWKFNPGDVRERGHWDAYMSAYEDAMNATSKPWAPWYAIPADSKPFMRLEVAKTVLATLDNMDLAYPTVSKEDLEEMHALRGKLAKE